MHGYTKLFGSIVASTIWREDNTTRIVWITMLALKDQNGVVEASIPGLADLARVKIDELLAALRKLQEADPYSRTKEFEGRRIEEVEGGWRVLNHRKYRDKLNQDERREYLRIKQQEHRDREKAKQETKPEKPPKEVAPNPEHAAFIKGWCDNFQTHFNAKYNFSGRDARAVKDLLRLGILAIDLLEIAKRAWLRSSQNPYSTACKKATTTYDFLAHLNAIQAELKHEHSNSNARPDKPNPRNFGIVGETTYDDGVKPRLQRELEEKKRLAQQVAADGGKSSPTEGGAGFGL